MKRFLKGVAVVFGTLVAVIAGAAAYIAASPIPSYPVQTIDLKVDVTPERVARGKRTAEMLCAACHLDAETGIGKWTEAQFRRALVDGIGPDNRPLRYPMVPYRNVKDDEAAAMFAYLQTVPAIKNAVPAPKVEPLVGADRGQQIDHSYGCNGCHGEKGLGTWDLRKGPAHYPTDEALIAYIKHPEVAKPGIAMPTWDGVIQDDEYGPLVAYVRSLAQ